MNPFAYPSQPHQRRQGPSGYAHYEGYRPWLRDEFSFRCVYCLTREQWTVAKGTFAIDHFVPVSINSALGRDYDNLLYVCVACNLTHGNRVIPNPLEHLLASTTEVQPDGRIIAYTPAAQEIVESLHLNDPKYVFRRQQMIELVTELEKRRPDLLAMWLGYPDDLPDLASLRPPGGNRLPGGIDQSYLSRRRRGELSTA
jgi:hypothetical protein